MRALVLSNCAYQTYTESLQKLFPDWDTRGVLFTTAEQWIAEEHAGFLDFVGQIDLCIGMTRNAALSARLGPSVRCIPLPEFNFRGYHPDSVWLHGIPAPTETGALHSRIAAACWAMGRTRAETLALFGRDHFEALGYFDAFATERRKLLALFAEEAGLDISGLFDGWSAGGNFLYTVNHPVAGVFYDILRAAIVDAGYVPTLSAERQAQIRAELKDALKDGILWPVYPQIAGALGIPAEPAQWRTSAARGNGIQFDLAGMIERSWRAYDAHAHLRPSMIRMLGGQAEVDRLAAT